eukprot:SAG31_NODE_2836_length_5019_cov_2.059350_4_plen_93_part_00
MPSCRSGLTCEDDVSAARNVRRLCGSYFALLSSLLPRGRRNASVKNDLQRLNDENSSMEAEIESLMAGEAEKSQLESTRDALAGVRPVCSHH